MDLENTKLKIKCNHCGNHIILTYHTIKCPKCGTSYDPEEVKQIFHNYESNVENSKVTQVGNALTGAGEAMQGCGQVVSSLGCLIILIFLLIPLLHFIFSLM